MEQGHSNRRFKSQRCHCATFGAFSQMLHTVRDDLFFSQNREQMDILRQFEQWGFLNDSKLLFPLTARTDLQRKALARRILNVRHISIQKAFCFGHLFSDRI